MPSHVPALCLLGMLASASASAQSTLPDLSLEDLMTLDAGQVFGASERLQPAIEAPASVSFITADEIRRFGYRTLADILRGVRGMYVTNDRNFSLIGTRGFAKPGDYNSRILLLVNGHRMNDNAFGQAEIGAEFGLDPAIFERVEIIRGPASSLYGDSAFFAVVNVITKTGASLDGGTVTVEAGTLGTELARMTFGRRFASGVDVGLSGTYEQSDGVRRLYFPAWDDPDTNNGVAEGLDGESAAQFYGRLAFKGLTVTTAYGTRQRDVPTASFGSVFNEQTIREETTDRHTLIDATYGRTFSGARLTVGTSFDRFSASGVFPYPAQPGGSSPWVARLETVGARWAVNAGLTRTFRGGHTVRGGFEFIDNLRQDQNIRYVDPPLELDRPRSSTQRGVYLQDEVRLTRWLLASAGLRYDGFERFHRFSPRAALIFLPSSTQSLKYLYGRAFRTPNAYELNDLYFGDLVTALGPESIDTHELVWERYVNDWLRTSVSTYWYKADQLVTLVPDTTAFLGTTYINQGEVRANGLEFETQMRLMGQAQALVSYAVQRAVDQETQAELPNSPRHLLKGRFSLPGPTPRSLASAEVHYMSGRDTIRGTKVAGAAVLNLTLAQPFGRAWEIFGSVRNIFDTRYQDPVSDLHRQDSIPQNGRTARLGVRWQLRPQKPISTKTSET